MADVALELRGTPAPDGPAGTPGDGLRERQIALIGQPPAHEYLMFASQAAQGGQIDPPSLMAEWHQARSHLDDLALSEPGIADNQTVGPLPSEMDPLRARYLADPGVRRAFFLYPPDLGLVELDHLVVFQRSINLTYAAQLHAHLPAAGDHQSLFDFCLGLTPPPPPVEVAQVGNGYVFVSPSTDLRVLGSVIHHPGQLIGAESSGRPMHVVGIPVGYGINALNVIRVGTRLILNNGSHRAYALRAAGHTLVPAVIQDAGNGDGLMGVPQIEQNKDLYLKSARPPLFKDYFDQRLHREFTAPAKVRQVRVTIGVDVQDAPKST